MTTLTQTRHTIGAHGVTPREENDFYATPPEATRALLAVEQFNGRVWDPACGDGAILKEFPQGTYGTDLVYRGYGAGGHDFLAETALPHDVQNIVTNPPFRYAADFIEHSIALGASKACFLLRLQFLEGQRRRPLLEKLTRVHVFSKRIPRMHNPNWTGKKTTSLIAFAWFVWERGNYGARQLNFINPIPKEPNALGERTKPARAV